MKTLLLTVTLMTLFTSCGGLNEMCGSDLRMGCNTVFGELPKDYDDRLDTIEDRLDDVEADLRQLFARDAFLETRIDNSVMAIIKPCPTAKEVLLKFDNGILLAYFENGGNRYLSELSNGSYVTSDGTGCNFTVTGSGTANLAVTQN